jgi:hypothetical protein
VFLRLLESVATTKTPADAGKIPTVYKARPPAPPRGCRPPNRRPRTTSPAQNSDATHRSRRRGTLLQSPAKVPTAATPALAT